MTVSEAILSYFYASVFMYLYFVFLLCKLQLHGLFKIILEPMEEPWRKYHGDAVFTQTVCMNELKSILF